MTKLLEIAHMRKNFAERNLFEIENFALNRGQAYVLTGMNGSGKSTLLRVLAGLESAHIKGFKLAGVAYELTPYPAALRAQIGFVHQHPIVFSTTVQHNLAYGLRLQKGGDDSKNELQNKIQSAAEWAGLQAILQRPAQLLSGGEKQRVALARAWLLNPQLLLLDEPTANLDGAARESVLSLIVQLAQQGKTVLTVCHDRDVIGMPEMQRIKLTDGRLEWR